MSNNYTLYDIFIKKLKINEKEFYSLVLSYVKKRVGDSYSDISLGFSDNDFNAVVNDVYIDLISRGGEEEKFKNTPQVKSYINMVVKNKTSAYVTGVVSPVKMVNPKGGESKEKGAPLTNAVNFRATAYELDKNDFSHDHVCGLEIEEAAPDPEILLRYKFHINPILAPIMRLIFESSLDKGLEELLRIDNKNEKNKGRALSSSYFCSIVSEKISSVSINNEKPLVNSHLLNGLFGGVKKDLLSKGVLA